MAEDDKIVSRLNFDIGQAEEQLKSLAESMTKLSTVSDKTFDKVAKIFNGKNLTGKSSKINIDLSDSINIDTLKKKVSEVKEYNESQIKKIATTTVNENIKTTGVINREYEKRKSIEYKANKQMLVSEMQTADKIKVKQQELSNYKEKMELKEQYRNKSLANSTKSIYDKISDYAQTYLIYQGFNQLRQSASELVKEMVNVESQMVQIDRVLNDSTLNVNNYRDQLIQLAYDYGNSFENVADITLRLAQAGFDAQQSLALTEKTLLALNTAELDATQATDDMVAVMAQWGKMEGDAAEVADEYAAIIDKVNRTADKFPTTSADILDALKKTSSAFNIAGASIDETIASIVAAETVSQRGGKAIGIALNNIINQLKDDKRLDIAESLGINFYKDEGKTEFKDIMDIMSELSAKMQELKNSGKESSVEMQNLTEVFTVFRRNIGSSLLGEMGEGGVYQQVLDLVQAEDTLGYSLQENSKYMATAKAAQEQYNAALLQLKTRVWDAGVEDVFRGILLLGTDTVKVLNTLIDTFGAVPVAIGAVTLAFNLLKKESQLIKTLKTEDDVINSWKKMTSKIEETTVAIRANNVASNQGKTNIAGLGKQFITAGVQATTATVRINLMRAALIGLQAIKTLGLSAAITALISGFDYLLNNQEKEIEKSEEIISKKEEEVNKNRELIKTTEDLIQRYEQYSNLDGMLNEEQQKELSKTQKEVTNFLIEQNKWNSNLTGNYSEQLKILKEITEEKNKQKIQDLQAIVEEKRKIAEETQQKSEFNLGKTRYRAIERAGADMNLFREALGLSESAGSTFIYREFFETLPIEKQIELLEKWKEQIIDAGNVGSKGYEWIEKSLEELRGVSEDVDVSIGNLNSEILSIELDKILDKFNIDSLEDYNRALEDIKNTTAVPEGYEGDLDNYKSAMEQLIMNTFPQFSGNVENAINFLTDFDSIIEGELNKLDKLSNSYSTLSSAVKEYNNNGAISIETFRTLQDNDLLQYLDIVNGKLVINKEEMNRAAEASRTKIEESIKLGVAEQILAIATEDTTNQLKDEKSASDTSVTSSNNASEAANKMAASFSGAAISIAAANDALRGQNINVDNLTKSQSERIKKVIEEGNKNLSLIGKMSYQVAKSSGGASKSATETFEEQSNKRIEQFKKEISEYEKLETQWVNKYKKLNIFGTDDLKYITQQRINRYKDYLNQVRNLTGITEEDRAELIREYNTKIQEYELEYFDLLKDQLDDQIDAYEKANQEKIDSIKEAAEAEIEALQKVEDENDRIREKEEYERKRQELIYGHQGIEYWRQRTGRDAQLALAEAEKELEELDRDWKEKQEDWTLEDQIKEIEDARDAQVKAIEEAQEIQIQAWRDAYQAQVNMYAETGQIIFDNSVINAGYLYNAYMNNFVQPLQVQLETVANKVQSTASSLRNAIDEANKLASITNAAQVQGAKEEVVDWNTIQKRYVMSQVQGPQMITTSVPKFNVGKYHDGGIVGSRTEALALVKPNEVILTPEWAAGLDKLVARINAGENIVNNNTSTTTKIEVDGNLVNIDANIKNQSDISNLTKEIEKVLVNKFNIKK